MVAVSVSRLGVGGVLALVAAAGMCGAMAGCAGAPKSGTESTTADPKQQQIDEAAARLQEALEKGHGASSDGNKGPTPPAGLTRKAANPAAGGGSEAGASAAGPAGQAGQGAEESAATPLKIQRMADVPKPISTAKAEAATAAPAAGLSAQQHAAELARLLGEKDSKAPASGGEARAEAFGRALNLALLSGIEPAAASAALEGVRRGLDPAQQQVVEAVREMAAGFSGAAVQGPAGVLRLVQAAGVRASAGGALTVPACELASRVDAFGRFAPLSGTFLVGTPSAALLYTEVDGFSNAPLKGEATDDRSVQQDPQVQWVVALSQKLELFASDGTLVWNPGRQVLRDASRNQRRDFFMVQRLEWPAASLAVGRYNLKSTVTDENTGAQVERIVPVQIVADAAMVRARASTPSPMVRPAASSTAESNPAAPLEAAVQGPRGGQ